MGNENAECTNSVGSYSCKCNAGYDGNGKDCADINECEGSNTCIDTQNCVNTVGSYECNCKAEFVENEDEATKESKPCLTLCEKFELNGACGTNSACVVTDGVAACKCDDGFEENSEYAADRNNGPINGKCSRIDPCNPGAATGLTKYDCSAIDHTECVMHPETFEGACQCIENYLPYDKDGDTYTKFHEENPFKN